MSILIKDMEMPREKKIILTIFPDGRAYKNNGERLWGYGKDCIPWKAVQVPPHGRLTDVDALCEKFMSAPPASFTPKEIATMIEWEEVAPTIISAEEGE